ncbi:MAG: GH36-type glycosyl hydrolase domain-containing protein, partial [Gemmatimonadota bacterium]
GEVWTATPAPAGEDAPYEVRHEAGCSTFRHQSHGLRQELALFCPPDAPVKVARLRLTDLWGRPRRFTVTYYAEWVLGSDRSASAPHVVSEYDPETQALLARCPLYRAYGARVAFLGASQPVHGLTTDRVEFLGEGGPGAPSGLGRIGLSGTVEPGLDPCAALQVHIDLPPDQEIQLHFVLGQGADRDEALALLRRWRSPDAIRDAREAVERQWDDLLGAVTVTTPEPTIDLLLNRWLLYQTVSGRLWGRTGLYQSSGAFGFRDQLQDVLALLQAAPELARAHILEAAAHQFPEGDVLHWWHPGRETGVRTRCSDDLLWLPYAVATYVCGTGDVALLDERVPFLDGEPLRPDEEERYATYRPSPESASVFEHCIRAIERGSTWGRHGLPLIGTGDWNDGLDRVGHHGQGESVWLGWFLIDVLRRVAPLCEARGEPERALELERRAEDLARRLETAGWDGAWYRRAYYDDGAPLGSTRNVEARIDAISQAWSVLSRAADPERAARAMQSVEKRLHDRDEQLLLLLAPPFDRGPRDPGYIKAYPPGVRENGGQYSHAAAWVGWAFADLGDPERAHAVLRRLDPVRRSATPDLAARYRVEPYVTAADVYGVSPYTGRGGWTWYTGSAGWTYRFALERLLGVRREGDVLRIEPCVPDAWGGFEVVLRHADASYHIRVERVPGSSGCERVGLALDGDEVADGRVPLRREPGAHEVRVRIGRQPRSAAPLEGAARPDPAGEVETVRPDPAGDVETVGE